MMFRSTLALTLVMLAGSTVGAEELKSGPQVGDRISGRFDPTWLNGDPGGGNHCPV